ncbi:glycosyltransferase, partial [Acinetobacter baumannii]|uniref:glycosyltransferase n=1 Tax=Acinetobacter baumannii TaxID=470 RepID=UPI0039F01460
MDAFELLWEMGSEVTLVIAGREGWCVEALSQRLRCHLEAGKRLVWLADVSDAQLAALYANLGGLIMPSEAEGFGLPLVEAARYGMPLLVRDLPVFREVVGEHASYFS